jgi:hypothetical protein
MSTNVSRWFHPASLVNVSPIHAAVSESVTAGSCAGREKVVREGEVACLGGRLCVDGVAVLLGLLV